MNAIHIVRLGLGTLNNVTLMPDSLAPWHDQEVEGHGRLEISSMQISFL
jgi:hypothetical protein